MRLMVTAATVLLLTVNAADAGKLLLYDDEDCDGDHRLLVESESDLERMDFHNDAESVRVESGVWSFHRDVNYFNGSGPQITLGPGPCRNFGEGEAVSFPEDTLDSVQLLQPGTPVPGAIVLFDGRNLAPPYRVVIGNVTDLDDQDFNDRTESVRVLLGNWRLYRGEGFATGEGPPVPLGPGTYPDIELQGFPGDEASSVMRIPD